MRLLFTGSSGFLGNNTIPLLNKWNYQISVLNRIVGDICCDLSVEIPRFVDEFDIVLHAAAKAHSIPKTPAEEQLFYDVNFIGTQNLCLGLEQLEHLPQHFIFISTVAVYGIENGEYIDERYPLNGSSPYAKSKILAENYLIEWCEKHNVRLSILRPSLIAGIDPPGNLVAMIKGIDSQRYLSIAGGKASKSVLMASDIAYLIPLLAKNKGGIFNVCDSHHPTFGELECIIATQLGKSKPISIPLWIARLIAWAGDILGHNAPLNTNKLNKIIKPLTFSNLKAKNQLGWQPLDVLANFKIKR